MSQNDQKIKKLKFLTCILKSGPTQYAESIYTPPKPQIKNFWDFLIAKKFGNFCPTKKFSISDLKLCPVIDLIHTVHSNMGSTQKSQKNIFSSFRKFKIVPVLSFF